MRNLASAALLALVATAFVDVHAAASQTNARRANEIMTLFTKHKEVSKSKRGVTRERYKDVRAEPVVRSNLESLSGTYEDQGFGFVYRIRVDANGRVTGSGEEPIEEGVKRTFTLSNATVSGALIRGTKVYAGGRTQPLEGAFLNRISRESPADPGTSAFGLGIVGDFTFGQWMLNRIFLERTR
ncbi:MAG TPA: hypothetical protein VM099_13020 [Gemmatimonadaceae bacterium]|nr:hypothetical protein [Gemmatimonadaceae bacterium]